MRICVTERTSVTPPQTLPWPDMPYKGFSFYGPNDVPLFAGREQQIIEFARIVGMADTRFVLLYGATGCGKSSFLRAGLIPFLEARLRGFEFRKHSQNQKSKALFIRSTDTPLQELAKEIFKLCSEGYVFTSPMGQEHVDLHGALLGKSRLDDFARLVVREPVKLIESLRFIAVALPVTLVLVIDQGEEVLSLRRGLELEDTQATYFKFLALFGLSDFPLKLIIALRNEYYGDFQAAINEQFADPIPILYFRLKNLGAKELVDAIQRPTQPQAVDGYGPPMYGFKFEGGLPERIVDDLIRTAKAGGLVGGELPVLQVVCETLYSNTKSREKPWTITTQDYVDLGEIETQLNDYVDRVLISFCNEKEMPANKHALEILRWKDALTELAKIQANNTVTTDRKTIDDLVEAAGKSVNHFGELLEYLSEDDRAVLREETIRKLGFETEIPCYSLRHDAVGLVLVRWQAARKASRGISASAQLFNLVGALGYILAGIVGVFLGIYNIFGEGASLSESWLLFAGALGAGLVGVSLLAASSRVVPEFQSYRLQLLAVRSPIFRFFTRVFIRGRILDAEGLKELAQNPVFRLYMRTTPDVQRLFNRASQRFDVSKGREANR